MSLSVESVSNAIRVRWLGLADYERVWKAMQTFTLGRSENSKDELWLVEHPPVYTLGMNCKEQTVSPPNGIPIIKTDRGGQITYHGPGQVIIYAMVDLHRLQWGIKRLVQELEQIVIDLLAKHDIQALRREGAPGVYVEGKKIAALGLRVRRGCSYHGLAINVDMDLRPFDAIDPCGYPGLQATQLADLKIRATPREIGDLLCESLAAKLGYNSCDFTEENPD